MEKLDDLVLLVNSKNNPFDNYSTVKDETILAIAEAFRVLEQRAEAVEKESARLADWVKCVEAERDKNIAWHASQLKRAESADAKLAELEKRKPDFHVRQIRTEQGPAWTECGADYARGSHFFTRPAPAVSLAELVQRVMPAAADNNIEQFYGCSDDFCVGWNHHAAAVLRNIEEAG